MESGDPTVQASIWKNSVYIAAGQDPFVLVEKAVEAAASLSGGALPRHEKKQPDSLNWFGWCTWDAYYSKVSARGMSQGCNVDLFGEVDFAWKCSTVALGNDHTEYKHKHDTSTLLPGTKSFAPHTPWV